jgi:hypothetical protein
MSWVRGVKEGEKTMKYIPGVRVNCLGNIEICKRPMYELLKLPEGQSHMLHSQPSKLRIPVAEKTGFPFISHGNKANTSLPWRGRHINGVKAITQDYNFPLVSLNPEH